MSLLSVCHCIFWLCVCVLCACVCVLCVCVCVCVCVLQKEDGMSVEDRVAFALTYLPDIQVRNILTKGLAHLWQLQVQSHTFFNTSCICAKESAVKSPWYNCTSQLTYSSERSDCSEMTEGHLLSISTAQWLHLRMRVTQFVFLELSGSTLFQYLFHPFVTAVAWVHVLVILPKVQVADASTLHMWLCMKWHGAWLCGVHRTHWDGSSFM